jgi:hypothetical protein
VDTTAQQFGCDQCFRCSAEQAAQARQNFVGIAALVDESHFIVSIRACPHCGQHFVSLVTELIDWAQGDDAQYSSLLPLTEEESQELILQGEQLNPRRLEELGRERRFLQIDFPTGKPKRVAWANGRLAIGPHD